MLLSLAVALIAAQTAFSDSDSWEPARLLPTVAWMRGHEVYCTPSSGSVQSTMYPPGWIVAYSPVGWFTTPNSILTAGFLLTQLFCMVPVAWLQWQGRPPESPTLASCASAIGGSMFVWLVAMSPALTYSCATPHADAPAIGFAILAILFATSEVVPGRLSLSCLTLTALCAAMAVWSKQTMVPLFPALMGWRWVRGGMRGFVSISVALLAASVATLVAFASQFPLDALWFNIVTIPARCPWVWNSAIKGLGLTSIELVQSLSLLAAASILLGTILSALRRPEAAKGAFKDEAWQLALVMSACMFPVSVLGRVKVGGDINTFSPTLVFLALSVSLQLRNVVFAVFSRDLHPTEWTALNRGFVAFTSFVLATGLLTIGRVSMGFFLSAASRHFSQDAFDFLKNVDGRAFFPDQPLAHLLATNELYHYSYAVYDREVLASLLMTDRHLQSCVPEAPTIVVLQDRADDRFMDRETHLIDRVYRDRIGEFHKVEGWPFWAARVTGD